MKPVNTATISAAIGHGLAIAAFLWLLLWPGFYQGVSVTAQAVPEEGQSALTTVPTTEVTEEKFSSSLIQENGWEILPFLLAPVILTGLALLPLLWAGMSSVMLKWWLRATALLLLAFCLVAIWSIGLFFAPAAIAVILAAIIAPGRKSHSPATNTL